MKTTRAIMAAVAAEENEAPDPCLLVIFGASGDLTKRLLVPALYNLACDGLLPERFTIVGMALDGWSSDEFRERLSRDAHTFATRAAFDEDVWARLRGRLHYLPGRFDDPAAYGRLRALLHELDSGPGASANVLFYLAVPPALFGTICDQLHGAGLHAGPGARRIVIEKPFGTDLASARELNRRILARWDEGQVFRIDHYLGKETVQNILAFRFANELFEPLWNREHIDHVQLTVSEAVSVEGRGGYYDHAGVLRDMIQNHMFQVLAYMAMEAPASFSADDVRDAKARLLQAVRRYRPDEVRGHAVRGQYDRGRKVDGRACPAYREEAGVEPRSKTETFAALQLFIDNPRWHGVPIYLRSGKALWKRGTEVVVQLKRPPPALFAGQHPAANRVIFHIQPDQAIETLLQAKTPGPRMLLQPVNMRFDFGEVFKAARGTGYEVMLYSAMMGDATLFSRTDFVEAAWEIAQPILEAWAADSASDFPNYPAGTWGPRAASDLLTRDGRRWFEIVNRETLDRVPLFHGGDPILLRHVGMALRPRTALAGETIVAHGEPGSEMFLISRGEVEVLSAGGQVVATLRDGDFFGEIALLLSERRIATVRARTPCDLFVLERSVFRSILRDHESFAHAIRAAARARYGKTLSELSEG